MDANEAITMNPGDKFTFGDFEWVCLNPHLYQGDGVLAIMAKMYTDERGRRQFKFDENGNGNYKVASIRNVLKGIAERIGEQYLIPITMDLTADNGDHALGTFDEDCVTLMSADDFRQYRTLIPEYEDYVWTCTPWRIDDAGDASYVRICSTGTGGALSSHYAHSSYGVAPLVLFQSSIFNPPVRADEDAEESVASDSDLNELLFSW